ncbi:DivIVA domain-containing protein [Kocuria sp. CPCC 205292]|uniref:DivIVA domain-containing protein n=1 Tax=Kocuria cellulosilytica TaxID=3071451 RepID=UPI0034D3F714
MPSEPPGARPPTARIPRCSPAERGYDVEQVDDVLVAVRAALGDAPDGPAPDGFAPVGPAGERPRALTSTQVRAVAFAAARGGYRPEAVDELLEAAEDALAAAEREQCLRVRGPEAWQEHVDALARLLRNRLDRPRTQRFRRPSRPRAQGYSAAHVDVLCERLGARLTGAVPLEPAELRRAVFPPAQGERSYEEQQVDAFLDRAVQLLLAVR